MKANPVKKITVLWTRALKSINQSIILLNSAQKEISMLDNVKCGVSKKTAKKKPKSSKKKLKVSE
jgi:hypothetical protein